MWIMLTKKPPTQPSPPRLSIHWSVPWPHEKYAQKQQETCQRCGCRVQEGVSSSKSKKRGKHKLTLGCICPGGPTIVTEEDREIYTELGAEHNWSGARAIEYKGERIRVFPDEFSILNTERMREYVSSEEHSHSLVPASVVQGLRTSVVDLVLDADSRFVRDAALLDGCDEHDALMVALGMNPSVPDAEYPPVGWYRCHPDYAEVFCTPREMEE